jgi:hypothetical protein
MESSFSAAFRAVKNEGAIKGVNGPATTCGFWRSPRFLSVFYYNAPPPFHALRGITFSGFIRANISSPAEIFPASSRDISILIREKS